MYVKDKVKQGIQYCHAPVSGYCVSCALITEKGMYFGQNYEKENPTIFEHAETRAIKEMLRNEDNPRIQKIIMYGGGKIQKMKHYIPCFSCTEALQSFMTDDTLIELLPLAEHKIGLQVTAAELKESYKDLPYSFLKGSSHNELIEEIEEKSLLKKRDLQFITDLALFGKESGIEFYLTGSATGRGGVSNLILKKTGGNYQDLDIIAATEDKQKMATEGLERLIKKHFEEFVYEARIIPSHHNPRGVVVSKAFYHHSCKTGLIDFTLSRDFRGAFCYRQYELRNWFHQLS